MTIVELYVSLGLRHSSGEELMCHVLYFEITSSPIEFIPVDMSHQAKKVLESACRGIMQRVIVYFLLTIKLQFSRPLNVKLHILAIVG